ncbi:GrdX family protein [uncultured Ilyobacter sp.]|uniref:GrdX family protein n=1 Tax=uncultured Ilyobacter sp. TaxID=544433 RepID=UPI0029F53568|nr:GrdX family protein [uncultured Ilyobacter sp.]
MKYIIVTNNSKVYNFYKETDEIIHLKDGNFYEVLTLVREKVHEGHILLSDPIFSNIECCENPFKSIAISVITDPENEESVKLMEGAMKISKKLICSQNHKSLPSEILEEYRFIDLNLIRDGIVEIR